MGKKRGGFTLLEMLAVTGILALLIGLQIPFVLKARAKARQTNCRSNLRQLAVALNVYRSEHRGRNPGWLSNLYPDYVDTPELFICPADKLRGRQGGKPDDANYRVKCRDSSQFTEADDNDSNGSRYGRNPEVHRCSYLYEFNAALCNWSNGSNTWNEAKLDQLRNGDAGNGYEPYGESRMPIIRCFHHWSEGMVPAQDVETGYRFRDYTTLNVGYAGNIFVAPIMWEERVDGLQ